MQTIVSHRNASCSIEKHTFVEITNDPVEAVREIPSNSRVMIGGFGLCGVPEALIEGLAATKVKDLTVISNEGGAHHHGLDQLFDTKQIKRMVCSFIGDNKEFQRQFLSGELEVELVPQGNLVERIRCGGAGIPAFYTPTGVNTVVHLGGNPIKFQDGKISVKSEPKEVISKFNKTLVYFLIYFTFKAREIDGKTYMMEKAIKAEYALIKGWKADKAGNVIFRKSAANFNMTMAKAAKFTIVEVEEIVEIGQLDPNFVHLPGIYVDRILKPPKTNKYIDV
jgi:3-oxoacid CoA-transferase